MSWYGSCRPRGRLVPVPSGHAQYRHTACAQTTSVELSHPRSHSEWAEKLLLRTSHPSPRRRCAPCLTFPLRLSKALSTGPLASQAQPVGCCVPSWQPARCGSGVHSTRQITKARNHVLTGQAHQESGVVATGRSSSEGPGTAQQDNTPQLAVAKQDSAERGTPCDFPRKKPTPKSTWSGHLLTHMASIPPRFLLECPPQASKGTAGPSLRVALVSSGHSAQLVSQAEGRHSERARDLCGPQSGRGGTP